MSKNPSRVALFWTRLKGGGAERIMLTLAEEFLDRDIEVDIVLVRKEGELVDDIPSRARVFDLQAPRILASLPGLIRYLRKHCPPVLLSALSTNCVALWARGVSNVKTRIVISQHSVLPAATLQDWGLAQSMRLTYPLADRMIAVSEGVATDMCQSLGLRREKIDVVYNPVINSEIFKRYESDIDHPWFSSKNGPVIIGVGRLAKEKGFDQLIQAFKMVSTKKESAKLVILGEGDERSELEKLADSLNVREQLWMPGFVSNPLKYMAQASVFVLPSLGLEGLPTVLIEAMASGSPIVASDCPSGPREILKEGKYGQLVPVGEPSSLAEGIEKALDGEVQPAPRSALDRFRRNKVTERYIDIFSSLLQM